MRRALLLTGQLLTYPESRFRAAYQGEEISVWHWPHVPRMLADLYDMQKSMMAAFGGVTLTDGDLYSRPRVDRPEKVPTIADFDVAGFMRQLNS